jgi:hypothetical protein
LNRMDTKPFISDDEIADAQYANLFLSFNHFLSG